MAIEKSPPRHARAGRRHAGRPPRYLLATLGAASLSRVETHHARLVLGPGKLLWLVTYLVCRPARRAGTDELVELLWSDRDAVAGHHDLRQALWQVRRRLGPEAVTCARGEVILRCRVTVDRDAFLKAVERGALSRAVTLYRGDFLIRSPRLDTSELEQWVTREAYRLRRLFTRAAESVVRGWVVRGCCPKALALARRVRDGDPDRELGWGLVLETLVAMGDRAQANAEADVLERSVGIRPLAAGTRELVARVRGMAGPGLSFPHLKPGVRHPWIGSPPPKPGSRS